MLTPHCKVCEPSVIQVDLLKVEKPSVDSLSLLPELQYTREDDFRLLIFGIKQVVQRKVLTK